MPALLASKSWIANTCKSYILRHCITTVFILQKINRFNFSILNKKIIGLFLVFAFWYFLSTGSELIYKLVYQKKKWYYASSGLLFFFGLMFISGLNFAVKYNKCWIISLQYGGSILVVNYQLSTLLLASR